MGVVTARCLLPKSLPAVAIQLLLLLYDALAYLPLEQNGVFFFSKIINAFYLSNLSFSLHFSPK